MVNCSIPLECNYIEDFIWDRADDPSLYMERSVILVPLWILFNLSSIILNTIILIAVNNSGKAKYRTTTILITQQAWTDLLYGTYNFFFFLYDILVGFGLFGEEYICVIYGISMVSLFLCSYFHLCFIAIIRYLSVIYKHEYSRSTLWLGLMFCILLSIITSLIHYFTGEIIPTNSYSYCLINLPKSSTFCIIYSFIILSSPALIVFYCYAKLSKFINQQYILSKSQNVSETNNRRMIKMKNFDKLVFLLLFMFGLTSLPMLIPSTLELIIPNYIAPSFYDIILSFTGTLSHTVNPILYALSLDEIRVIVRQMIYNSCRLKIFQLKDNVDEPIKSGSRSDESFALYNELVRCEKADIAKSSSEI